MSNALKEIKIQMPHDPNVCSHSGVRLDEPTETLPSGFDERLLKYKKALDLALYYVEGDSAYEICNAKVDEILRDEPTWNNPLTRSSESPTSGFNEDEFRESYQHQADLDCVTEHRPMETHMTYRVAFARGVNWCRDYFKGRGVKPNVLPLSTDSEMTNAEKSFVIATEAQMALMPMIASLKSRIAELEVQNKELDRMYIDRDIDANKFEKRIADLEADVEKYKSLWEGKQVIVESLIRERDDRCKRVAELEAKLAEGASVLEKMEIIQISPKDLHDAYSQIGHPHNWIDNDTWLDALWRALAKD